jgi:hypothetical protein
LVVAFGAGVTEGGGDGEVTDGDGVTDGVAVVGSGDVAVEPGVAEGDGDTGSEGSGASEVVSVGVGVGVASAVAAPATSVD